MVLLSAFLVNLLCAISPCDFVHDPPASSISRRHYVRQPNGQFQLKNEYPIVETKSGRIQGYSMGTLDAMHVHAFEGIRYAQPPVNHNRFRPPIPANSWSGVLRAFKTGPACLQIHPLFIRRVIGSEDCLFLNIYAPAEALAAKANIPVVIFLHGGSFVFGESAEYGPAYIVDKNVILVTLNYRLGVLGFMSTGDAVSPGNNGLKDQALAMKWIHENCDSFGGDPNRITLMGQSAGGASVHMHMLSTQSRNYFQSGISLSANAFSHWNLHSSKKGRMLTNRLAKIARCPNARSQELVDCLRRKDPAFLVGYQLRLFTWLLFPPVLFAPVIETDDSPDPFISATPEELYARGQVAKYPWIVTQTLEEGHLVVYFLSVYAQLGTFRRHFDDLLPVVMDYEYVAENITLVNQEIKSYYLNNQSALDVSYKAILKIATDRYFTYSTIKAIRYHSEIAPTYSYLFSYLSPFNTGRVIFGLSDDLEGIAHLEDLFFFFNSTRYYKGFRKGDDEDFQMADLVNNLISNFAHTGEPLYTTRSGEQLQIWKPSSSHRVQFLEIKNAKNVGMIEDPFQERVEFWTALNLSDTKPFMSRTPHYNQI